MEHFTEIRILDQVGRNCDVCARFENYRTYTTKGFEKYGVGRPPFIKLKKKKLNST